MFAKVQDVREMGKLPGPEKLPDVVIVPHLEAAGRELVRRIGVYDQSPVLEQKRGACLEAECCICMSFLLPVMNTFFTQGIAGIQKEIGDLEFQFHGVDDVKKLAEMWMARAGKAVQGYVNGAGDLWYGAV